LGPYMSSRGKKWGRALLRSAFFVEKIRFRTRPSAVVRDRLLWDAKAGETVRPVRSPLLRQIHLTQQRFEARVAIEWHERRVCFDHQ